MHLIVFPQVDVDEGSGLAKHSALPIATDNAACVHHHIAAAKLAYFVRGYSASMPTQKSFTFKWFPPVVLAKWSDKRRTPAQGSI